MSSVFSGELTCAQWIRTHIRQHDSCGEHVSYPRDCTHRPPNLNPPSQSVGQPPEECASFLLGAEGLRTLASDVLRRRPPLCPRHCLSRGPLASAWGRQGLAPPMCLGPRGCPPVHRAPSHLALSTGVCLRPPPCRAPPALCPASLESTSSLTLCSHSSSLRIQKLSGM